MYLKQNTCVMEKMYKRTIQFLNKYIILYKYQFVFRENHSITIALPEIVDNILKNLEIGKYITGVYFDLSKVFDTINHIFLNHYGIRGPGFQMFESYLINRKQF